MVTSVATSKNLLVSGGFDKSLHAYSLHKDKTEGELELVWKDEHHKSIINSSIEAYLIQAGSDRLLYRLMAILSRRDLPIGQ